MDETKEMWKVECEYCGYSWMSEAKLGFVTCPNCQQKTKKIKTEEDWERINLRKKQRNKRQEN